MDWIAFSDHLPDKNQLILAGYDGAYAMVGHFRIEENRAFSQPDRPYFQDVCGRDRWYVNVDPEPMICVTHWMPIPKIVGGH